MKLNGCSRDGRWSVQRQHVCRGFHHGVKPGAAVCLLVYVMRDVPAVGVSILLV